MSDLKQWREVLDLHGATEGRFYFSEMMDLLKAGEAEVARLREQNKKSEKLVAALGSILVLTEGNDTPAHWFAIQQIAKETLELLDAK